MRDVMIGDVVQTLYGGPGIVKGITGNVNQKGKAGVYYKISMPSGKELTLSSSEITRNVSEHPAAQRRRTRPSRRHNYTG